MIKEYDYCLRCGRKLKSPENRIRGYGNICFGKMLSKKKAVLFTPNNQRRLQDGEQRSLHDIGHRTPT